LVQFCYLCIYYNFIVKGTVVLFQYNGVIPE